MLTKSFAVLWLIPLVACEYAGFDYVDVHPTDNLYSAGSVVSLRFLLHYNESDFTSVRVQTSHGSFLNSAIVAEEAVTPDSNYTDIFPSIGLQTSTVLNVTGAFSDITKIYRFYVSNFKLSLNSAGIALFTVTLQKNDVTLLTLSDLEVFRIPFPIAVSNQGLVSAWKATSVANPVEALFAVRAGEAARLSLSVTLAKAVTGPAFLAFRAPGNYEISQSSAVTLYKEGIQEEPVVIFSIFPPGADRENYMILRVDAGLVGAPTAYKAEFDLKSPALSLSTASWVVAVFNSTEISDLADFEAGYVEDQDVSVVATARGAFADFVLLETPSGSIVATSRPPETEIAMEYIVNALMEFRYLTIYVPPGYSLSSECVTIGDATSRSPCTVRSVFFNGVYYPTALVEIASSVPVRTATFTLHVTTPSATPAYDRWFVATQSDKAEVLGWAMIGNSFPIQQMVTNLVYGPVLDALMDVMVGFRLEHTPVPVLGKLKLVFPSTAWTPTCQVTRMKLPPKPACAVTGSTVTLTVSEEVALGNWNFALKANTPASKSEAQKYIKLYIQDETGKNLDASLELVLNPTVLPEATDDFVQAPLVSNFTLWWSAVQVNTLTDVALSFELKNTDLKKQIKMFQIVYPTNFLQGVRIGTDLRLLTNQNFVIDRWLWRKSEPLLSLLTVEPYEGVNGNFWIQFIVLTPTLAEDFPEWNFFKVRFCANTQIDACDAVVDIPVTGFALGDTPYVHGPPGVGEATYSSAFFRSALLAWATILVGILMQIIR